MMVDENEVEDQDKYPPPRHPHAHHVNYVRIWAKRNFMGDNLEEILSIIDALDVEVQRADQFEKKWMGVVRDSIRTSEEMRAGILRAVLENTITVTPRHNEASTEEVVCKDS